MSIDLETNKLSKNVDPYACAVRAKKHFFNSWKTVGHIPREISHHVYHHFMRTEGGFVNGSVISTKYCPLPIPSGGQEILLLLKFSCRKRRRLKK